MATVAQLNIEIGARVAELQKGLKSAEKSLSQSGARMSRIGNDITTSLSIPLGLAGVGAIKAAGDIESLTLALKSQLGTAEAAATELKELTKAAEKPGLGLEQAVRGSVRLQGVGFAAEEARKVLVQMGNAIAATGGSAQELDNVTRQFAQMTSKGRVLQEDVSILSENMPGLAQLMQRAFGTQSVEAIREMGVSGKEFVLQITRAAEELPRVESGIKNSIGNALDSLKQSAAKVGLAINSAFDITGGIETFSGYVLAIAEAFSNLNPTVQTTILSIAGLAIAIGPLIKAFGAIKSLGAQSISVFNGIIDGAKFLGGAVLNAAKSFQALNTAMKLSVVGAALAAVTALYFAYDEYTNSLTDAEAAQMSVESVKRSAIASTEVERAKIGNLVAVLEDNTRSLDDKKTALDQLQQINPKYFGGLDIEKGKVIGLTSAVDAYVRSLERSAIVKQATDELAKQSEILRNIGEGGDPTLLQQTGNAIKAVGSGLLFGAIAGANMKETFDNLNESTRTFNQIDLQATTQAKIESLRALIKENIDLENATEDTTNKFKHFVATSDEAKKAAKVLAEVLSDVANAPSIASAIGDDADVATIKALENGIKKLIDEGFKPASSEVQGLKSQLDALKDSVVSVDIIRKNVVSGDESGGIQPVTSLAAPTLPGPPTITGEALTKAQEQAQAYADAIKQIQYDLTMGNETFAASFQAASDLVAQNGTLMQNIFVGMGEAIMQTAAAGKTSLTDFANAATAAAAKIIKSYIQQGVAAAVSRALGTGIFPYNLILGGIAGAAASALFTKAIGAIGVKGFAKGTNYAPGGMALVGEQGPELVNLPTGSQVFSNPRTRSMLNGRGGENREISLTGEFALFGSDLLLMIERAKRKNDRLR